MKEYHLDLKSQGWSVYDNDACRFVTGGDEGIRYVATFEEAIDMLRDLHGTFCDFCGTKLRASEGDGPCSDCHETQCAEKTKEETPALLS